MKLIEKRTYSFLEQGTRVVAVGACWGPVGAGVLGPPVVEGGPDGPGVLEPPGVDGGTGVL